MITFDSRRSIVKKALTAVIDLFPLTLQGSFALVLTALLLRVYGYGSMDLVVFSLTICALTILIFSLFCAVVSGFLIQRRLRINHADYIEQPQGVEAEAGYPNETGFSIPAPKFLPLVKLSWKIVYPDSLPTRVRVSRDKRLYEEIVPARRCLSGHISRQFTVSDVLGFCRYSWRQEQPVACMVLPKTSSVKPLPLLRSLTAEDGIPNPSGNPDGDRMEIRPYVPGDSVRNIMWKVYARNRQLNVRLPEKSVFHSQRTIAYLLSSEQDEAAAAVARVALETGAFGDDWLFCADGSDLLCRELKPALQAVARSRALSEKFLYGLDDFIARTSGEAAAHCIVFAAAEMAPWLLPLKNTIARYSGQFSLVLATDGVQDSQAGSVWQKLFLRSDPTTQGELDGMTSRRDLISLLTELGQLVESTLIVDRQSGLTFDQNLRRVS